MNNLMLNEEIVIDQLDEIISSLTIKVDDIFIFMHFHLTSNTVLLSKDDLTNPKLRLSSIEKLEESIKHVSFMEADFEDAIIEIINQLPITYIQCVTLGDELSVKAYSSVENSKENLTKAINDYKEHILKGNHD